MASDVTLYIAEPRTGAIVLVQWLGMGSTIDAARSILERPPDHAERGTECWGRLTVDEVAGIVAAQLYEKGPELADIARQGERFPSDRYWWILHHDY